MNVKWLDFYLPEVDIQHRKARDLVRKFHSQIKYRYLCIYGYFKVRMRVTCDVLLFDGADPSLGRMAVPFSVVVKRFCFVPVICK